MFRSKKELERFVEGVAVFRRPKQRLEQYPTDAHVVAAAVWDAYMRGLLDTVIDLGCGTGRFAIAAAAMGARLVLCLDVDPEALEVAKREAESRGLLDKIDIVAGDAARPPLRGRFRVAFQNPPFGIWSGRGVDIAFLAAAVSLAEVVYTIHKLPTLDYVRRVVEGWGLRLDVLDVATLNIKPVFPHHRKRLHKVEVFLGVVWKD